MPWWQKDNFEARQNRFADQEGRSSVKGPKSLATIAPISVLKCHDANCPVSMRLRTQQWLVRPQGCAGTPG